MIAMIMIIFPRNHNNDKMMITITTVKMTAITTIKTYIIMISIKKQR